MKQKKNQGGFIVTIELLVLATVLVLGLIVGWTDVRDAVLAELSDVSESFGALNQSYTIWGVQNAAGTAATAGSQWQDSADTSKDLAHYIDQSTSAGSGNSGAANDVTFNAPSVPESTANPVL